MDVIEIENQKQHNFVSYPNVYNYHIRINENLYTVTYNINSKNLLKSVLSNRFIWSLTERSFTSVQIELKIFGT